MPGPIHLSTIQKKRRGVSLILVSLLVTLAILTLAAALAVNLSNTGFETRLDQLKKKTDALTNPATGLQRQVFKDFLDGLKLANGAESTATPEDMTEQTNKINVFLTASLQQQKTTVNKNLDPLFLPPTFSIQAPPSPPPFSTLTLQDLLQQTADNVHTLVLALDTLHQRRLYLETLLKTNQDVLPILDQDNQDTLKHIDENITDEMNNTDSLSKDFTNQKEALNDKINKDYNPKIKTLETQVQERWDHLQEALQEAKAQLQKLHVMGITTRDMLSVAGRIQSLSPTDHSVLVDVGKNQGLPVGMVLHVFEWSKYGGKHWKGKILIHKVFPSYSVASILEEKDPQQPIAAGDYVLNLFFNRLHPTSVLLLGTFDQNLLGFTPPQLIQQLKALNVVVEKAPTLTTTFALTPSSPLDPSDDNFKTVQELGIPVLPYEAIAPYLGIPLIK